MPGTGSPATLMTDRLLFITQYFAPAWGYGGPPIVLYRLTRELVNLGFSITVITTDSLDDRRQKSGKEIIDGVKVFRFPTVSNCLAYKFKLFYVPSIRRKIKNMLAESKFVFFSDLRAVLNWQVYPLVKSMGIPYGIFTFGQIPYDSGMKGQIKKVFDKLWVSDFVTSAKFRFCQTEHEREMYRQFSIAKENTQLLLLPIDSHSGKETGNKKNFRKRFGISETDFLLLYVGRLNKLKGIDSIIRSVRGLRNKYNITLLIVGRDDGCEGQLRQEAGIEAGKCIIFAGPLYEDAVYEAYRNADCFIVTPRFFEETSTAALEALSCGTPVITSEQSEIPYLEEYKAGIIVKDISRLETAILTMMLQRDKYKKGTISLIRNKYDSSKIAKRFVSFLT